MVLSLGERNRNPILFTIEIRVQRVRVVYASDTVDKRKFKMMIDDCTTTDFWLVEIEKRLNVCVCNMQCEP